VAAWLGQKLGRPGETTPSEPEIVLTTFETWQELATRLSKLSETTSPVAPVVYEKASALVRALTQIEQNSYNPGPKIEAIYDFVSQRIRYRRSTARFNRFKTRSPDDILSSGYGTQEDKFLLFAALARDVVTLPHAGLVSKSRLKKLLASRAPQSLITF